MTTKKGFIDSVGGWVSFVRNLTPKRQKALKEEFQRKADTDVFVEQYLLPDMLTRGFGFGRAATAEYLRSIYVRSFEQLDNLGEDDIIELAQAKGVGQKVFIGFLRYMTARGAACVGVAAGTSVDPTLIVENKPEAPAPSVTPAAEAAAEDSIKA